ncbi:MAG: hypothetical protein ACREFP_01605 [Acetobacteraceae bacterium]
MAGALRSSAPGDFVLLAGFSTLRRASWLEASALVLCNLVDHCDPAPIPQAPRDVLKRQLARSS